MSKECGCGCKNTKRTDVKDGAAAKNYQMNLKNKAMEHTPYGEKEPSTHTEYR